MGRVWHGIGRGGSTATQAASPRSARTDPGYPGLITRQSAALSTLMNTRGLTELIV
jgi:hypothetical protein